MRTLRTALLYVNQSHATHREEEILTKPEIVLNPLCTAMWCFNFYVNYSSSVHICMIQHLSFLISVFIRL